MPLCHENWRMVCVCVCGYDNGLITIHIFGDFDRHNSFPLYGMITN